MSCESDAREVRSPSRLLLEQRQSVSWRRARALRRTENKVSIATETPCSLIVQTVARSPTRDSGMKEYEISMGRNEQLSIPGGLKTNYLVVYLGGDTERRFGHSVNLDQNCIYCRWAFGACESSALGVGSGRRFPPFTEPCGGLF